MYIIMRKYCSYCSKNVFSLTDISDFSIHPLIQETCADTVVNQRIPFKALKL